MRHTVSDGSASMTNLFCFRSWQGVSCSSGSVSGGRWNITLNVIFIVAAGVGVVEREPAGGVQRGRRGARRELQATGV